MDFHSLAAAHLSPARRSKPVAFDEDGYYRSCPDLSSIRPRGLGRIAVAAATVVMLFVTLVPA